MSIAKSELILNPNGSIYHLHLKPEEIATTIITVGDQDRVEQVSRHFDSIETKVQHREFKTHTGILNGKRISVISTGIGPDNIDIVCNELDALVNIDFETRNPKEHLTSLHLIRIGTSGALQPDIPLDSFVASALGVGFDNLLHFYSGIDAISLHDFSEQFIKHTEWNPANSKPYAVEGSTGLLHLFPSNRVLHGITTTHVGFYGPQGRVLRLGLQDAKILGKIASFRYHNRKITNLEMETAALYGMSKLLGHQALSLNAILANRALETFSSKPQKTIDQLIEYTLETLTQ